MGIKLRLGLITVALAAATLACNDGGLHSLGPNYEATLITGTVQEENFQQPYCGWACEGAVYTISLATGDPEDSPILIKNRGRRASDLDALIKEGDVITIRTSGYDNPEWGKFTINYSQFVEINGQSPP